MLKQYIHIIVFLPYLYYIVSICGFYSNKSPFFPNFPPGMCFLSLLLDSLKDIRISAYLILLILNKRPILGEYQSWKGKSYLENNAMQTNSPESFS